MRQLPPQRAVQSRTQPQAIEHPAVHLRFHGITAEDIAAIIERERDNHSP